MREIATHLIHHDYQAPAGFESVLPPVHKAATIIFKNVQQMRQADWRNKSGYTYGLHGTPSTFVLEERIATLENARFCSLAPSGLAAVALVNMALLRYGDEVLFPDNVYAPNRIFAQHELAAWGIRYGLYDPMNQADLQAKLTPQTKLVWLEAPGSVTLEFPDLSGLVQVVQAYASAHGLGIVTALDNTWGAGGLALKTFNFGIDISAHALTKYPSGGADVLMGAVVTNTPELHQRIQASHMRLGYGVGGNDVELVVRGLSSMAVRYAAQDTSTRILAAWMQTQPQIAHVLHPALPDSPGHAHWKRHCSGAACLFSVVFQPELLQSQIDAFCENLRWFKLGYSWAGPMSLCVPYNMQALRSVPWPHAGGLVRFSVGLEAVADLQSDLAQALQKI